MYNRDSIPKVIVIIFIAALVEGHPGTHNTAGGNVKLRENRCVNWG